MFKKYTMVFIILIWTLGTYWQTICRPSSVCSSRSTTQFRPLRNCRYSWWFEATPFVCLWDAEGFIQWFCTFQRDGLPSLCDLFIKYTTFIFEGHPCVIYHDFLMRRAFRNQVPGKVLCLSRCPWSRFSAPSGLQPDFASNESHPCSSPL